MIKITSPAGGETNAELSTSVNPFTWEELHSNVVCTLGGRGSDMDKIKKYVESEIKQRALKMEGAKDRKPIIRFELRHRSISIGSSVRAQI
jgi:hypothetical protein